MTGTLDTRRCILDKILENEGSGWNPNEKSYRGIMPKTYKEFQRATDTSIPHSKLGTHPETEETVYAFYEWYLKRDHVWELPEYFQYMYADFVVNVRRPAIKIIQEIVRTPVDGIWGSETSRAVAEFFNANTPETRGENFVEDLVRAYDKERRNYYNSLASEKPEKYQRYLEGWLNRCDRVLDTVLRGIGNSV